MLHVVSILAAKSIQKQSYISNIRKFKVFMKLELCNILNCFYNFSDSEP